MHFIPTADYNSMQILGRKQYEHTVLSKEERTLNGNIKERTLNGKNIKRPEIRSSIYTN